MRRLALAIALAASSVALGCQQTADVVAYAAPLDTGGGGGNGGSISVAGSAGMNSGSGGVSATGGIGVSGGGGMNETGGSGGMVDAGGSGGSEPRDRTCDGVGYAYGLLTRVAVDGCTFDPLKAEVAALLYQHIWSQPPVAIDPEAAPPDVPCNMLSRPPDFYAWARPTSEGASSWMLCPAYCAALNQLLVEQESVLAECAADAGI